MISFNLSSDHCGGKSCDCNSCSSHSMCTWERDQEGQWSCLCCVVNSNCIIATWECDDIANSFFQVNAEERSFVKNNSGNTLCCIYIYSALTTLSEWPCCVGVDSVLGRTWDEIRAGNHLCVAKCVAVGLTSLPTSYTGLVNVVPCISQTGVLV